MDIKLHTTDKIRIDGSYGSLDNFIDITKPDYGSIAINLYASFCYIELRKKGDRLKLFTFPKKSMKKDCDLGWWEDAEVVYAINEQYMNK